MEYLFLNRQIIYFFRKQLLHAQAGDTLDITVHAL